MAPFIVRLITPLNINRFSKFFHSQNQEIICNETVTIDPATPQVCRYPTVPREMSDGALKSAMPLTSCVINVDRACMWPQVTQT